jgi:hypothetical protein
LPAEYISSKINSYSDVGVFDKFNVLYVGQAFGDGNRAALDRLKSHSTLQKILARTPYDLPDEEIVIFAFEYSQDQVFTTMDGRAEGAISDDSNEERLFNAIDNPPSKKQKISMIEAGLIRYFQPKYNKVFVNKFPSIKAKTLKSCLDLDVTGLVVELNTDELGFYLYSDVVSPKMHHFANYELVASKDRASFFNVTGMVDFPGVIGARN